MRQGAQGTILATPPAVRWPPDDTEESVVGTNLHQEAITNLRWGLNEVASMHAPPGGPSPWQALSQTAISGLVRWDGSRYTVLPDVFVYQHAIDERRATLSLEQEGPPTLIAEVLSPKTALADLNLERGKGYSYARAGVREYLILDPMGTDIAEQVQGWRLEGGGYVSWRSDAHGRWQSQQLPVAIAFEGARVVVYAEDGRRQLREGEVGRTVAALEDRLARQAEEIAELRRRLEDRGQE